jgi:hypothetical protein
MPLPVPRGVVVAMLALSSPASLAAETILRHALFPPEMDALRRALRPALTTAAWGLLGVTCVAAVVALPAHRAIHRRMVARAVTARPGDALAREEAMQGALYLGASVVQLPTLLSTATFMLGAALTPVAAALGVALLGVALLGAFGPRD